MRVGPDRDQAAESATGNRRILGIDPGTVATGWGVVELSAGSLVHVAHGAISAPPNHTQASRLARIYRGLREVLASYQPQGISLEKVFFARNPQSTLKLGQARGVALLAAAESGVAVREYSSAEIKLAVVGYGQATKEQVQKMVGSLLHLPGRLPADAADALAAAVCDLHQGLFRSRVVAALHGAGRDPRRSKTFAR